MDHSKKQVLWETPSIEEMDFLCLFPCGAGTYQYKSFAKHADLKFPLFNEGIEFEICEHH